MDIDSTLIDAVVEAAKLAVSLAQWRTQRRHRLDQSGNDSRSCDHSHDG